MMCTIHFVNVFYNIFRFSAHKLIISNTLLFYVVLVSAVIVNENNLFKIIFVHWNKSEYYMKNFNEITIAKYKVKKLIKRQKHNKITLTLKLEANFKY